MSLKKFLGRAFTYQELMLQLNKQREVLVKANIDGVSDVEYNAIWDTFNYVEKYFSMYNKPNHQIACDLSAKSIFNYHLKKRKEINYEHE